MLGASCRDRISQLIPAIFSHHSAEYLPLMTPSDKTDAAGKAIR
jgi:hypothetical protein